MPRVKTAASKPQRAVQVRKSNSDVDITNDDTSSEDEEHAQIRELCTHLPELSNIFHLHSKIGEGTFSSVYLGSLKQQDLVPDKQRRWFAIKHLVPTAHPARVEHELRCLRELEGKHNVINVELCLRNLDNIVLIMPYIPHRKFSDLILTFTAASLREYLSALLRALQHVHSLGIIHRDVKPSNFLFDPVTNRYQLIDFGLAQRIETVPPQTAKVSVQRAPLGDKLTNLPEHSANAPERRPSVPEHANGTENVHIEGETKMADVDVKLPMKRPRDAECDVLPEAKRAAIEVTRKVNNNNNNNVEGTAVPNAAKAGEAGAGAGGNAAAAVTCPCWGRAGVCRTGPGGCAARPGARAPRAGTQGFRPPEVLLKYTNQTTAVDVWAVGVVLLAAALRRHPALAARDDARALAELCALLGSQALARAATCIRRRLVLSRRCPGVCVRRLAARLRGAPPPPPPAARPAPCRDCRLKECVCRDPNIDPTEFDPAATIAGFPDSMFGLLYRLLEPDPRRRPSAADALRHPFFTQPLP